MTFHDHLRIMNTCINDFFNLSRPRNENEGKVHSTQTWFKQEELSKCKLNSCFCY